MTKEIDIAIVGSGSAGLCAGLWLSKYGVRAKIFEKRDGPLKLGHADGVQCRTAEIFESFRLDAALLDESHHIVEVTFWSAEADSDGIIRQGRTPDPAPGLTHLPHMVLRQGRVNELMLDEMKRINGQEVDYGCEVLSVKMTEEEVNNHAAYPVTLVVQKPGLKETYQAKYLLVSQIPGASATFY